MAIESAAKSAENAPESAVPKTLELGLSSQLQSGSYHELQSILQANDKSNAQSVNMAGFGNLEISDKGARPTGDQSSMQSEWETNSDGTSSFHTVEVTIHQNGDPDYPDVPAPPPSVEIQDMTP